MPHETIPLIEPRSWQEELRCAVDSPDVLLAKLSLPKALLPAAKRAHERFPLRVPQPYLARIQKGALDDPLLLQILPLHQELEQTPGFSEDPLDEKNCNAQKGLIQKYRGRVLLIAAPHCAINCRYCFRRSFDYEGNRPSREEWRSALASIQADTSIEEVILSGGDPLAVSDKQLSWLIQQIGMIKQIRRIRVHSRLPIVIPNRVTDGLLRIFNASAKQIVLVLHCNHPQEIDEHVKHALAQLRYAGVILLNQSVLLRSINDSANTLRMLSTELFSNGVLPYYLHMLDRVQGTAHFDVAAKRAKSIISELQASLPGYLVPKLVREEPGASSKTPVNGAHNFS